MLLYLDFRMVQSSSTAPGAWLPDIVGSPGVEGVKSKGINSQDVEIGEMIRLSALAYVEIRPSRAWRCAQTDYSCMNLDGSSWATLIRYLLFKKLANRRFHSPRHIAALLTTPPSHTLEERHLDLLFLEFITSVFDTESCAKPSVGVGSTPVVSAI